MKTVPVRSLAVAALILMLGSGAGFGKLIWPHLSERSQAMVAASGQLVAWAALGVMAVLVEKERAIQPKGASPRDDVSHVTAPPLSAP